MTPGRPLGELQLAILSSLWRRGRASVADVYADVSGDHGCTQSTVGTMLQKMERRDLVAHESEGRRYLYRATESESEVRRSLVGDLVRKLFGGDAKALARHLVSEDELEGADLEALREEIRKAEAERAGDEPRRSDA